MHERIHMYLVSHYLVSHPRVLLVTHGFLTIHPGGQSRRARVCSRERRRNQFGPTIWPEVGSLGPFLSVQTVVQTLLPQSIERERCQKLYSSMDDNLTRMITLTRQDKTGEKTRSERNGATHRIRSLLTGTSKSILHDLILQCAS